MATNIPPHNLTEVINACICVLENPEATLSDLMQHVTGPTSPPAASSWAAAASAPPTPPARARSLSARAPRWRSSATTAYALSSPSCPTRSTRSSSSRTWPSRCAKKRLEGISGLRDESDRNGMRIVIELKRDANPQVVLNRLFAQTQLQTSFSINMLALVTTSARRRY